MSKSLVKSSSSSGSGAAGIVPAVASGFVPGLGQLVNGEVDKAIGVFAVSTVAGLGIIGALPLIGALVGGATWIYGVGDAYFTGRKKR
jgi:TM2 domain-containing membrane protein YozV